MHSCSSSICPSSCISSDDDLDDSLEDVTIPNASVNFDDNLILISTYQQNQQNVECFKCKERDEQQIVAETNKCDDSQQCVLNVNFTDVIERLNSMKKDKQAINPGPPIITSEEERGPEDANLFVFHLPNGLTNFDLFLLFRRYGDLRSIHIMTNKNTNLSRGYGFVSYSNKHEADVAIDAMNGFLLGSKKLKVERKRTYDQLSQIPSSAPPSRPSSQRNSFDSQSSSVSSSQHIRWASSFNGCKW